MILRGFLLWDLACDGCGRNLYSLTRIGLLADAPRWIVGRSMRARAAGYPSSAGWMLGIRVVGTMIRADLCPACIAPECDA